MTFTRNVRHILLVALIAMVGYWFWPGHVSEEPWNVRRLRFYEAGRAAEPLIEAIGRFAERRGGPPRTLDDLVPGYIARIPETGIADCEQFKYASFGGDQVFVMWYDLGPLQGRVPAKPGKYPDGDPNHSILVFTIGEGGQVVDARLDRIPKGIKGIELDPQQWMSGTRRMEMALGLPDQYRLARMPVVELEKLLGPADGRRTMRDTPWELRINCPKGLVERDILIYWPGHNYPQQLYGGNGIQLGNWLYIQP
ncbi:MAG: hypothetical protein KDI63_00565 [Gammaproteobacteria bacterium]|nr:hypothetical protein [Gammaproteobacteria bacterium]